MGKKSKKIKKSGKSKKSGNSKKSKNYKKSKRSKKDKYKVLTTCYRTNPPKDGKGWCSTRNPMQDVNDEPTAERGWGFCSNEPDQADCNDYIKSVVDTDKK